MVAYTTLTTLCTITLVIWATYRLINPWRCKHEHCHYVTWNAKKMIKHITGRHDYAE